MTPYFEALRRALDDRTVVGNLLATLAVLAGILALRSAILRLLHRAAWASDEHRLRWTTMTRNTSGLLLTGGLVLIWGSELRTLALSVVAFSAAMVLATKELITCFTGGVLRASAASFTLGDRVEIGPVRGDVVNYGPLTTTIREIGPGHQWTGRAVIVPNSQLLTTAVINESYTQQYVLHVIRVPLAMSNDWKRAETLLLQAADAACAPYLDDATKHLERISAKHGLTSPRCAPRVHLHLPTPGELSLMLRVPAPAREKGRVEQQILRQFVESLTPAAS